MGTEIDGVNGIIKNTTSDGDITIKGNDGGSEISALVFDMSAAGAATFNNKIVATELDISGAIDVAGTTNLDVVDIDGAVDMATTLTLAGNADFNGALDVDGTTNLDVVDIDGAVNMATTALVTGVLTTTAATVFNGGFASNAASTITTADNTDTLSLISTDADANVGPNLNLYRNSSSPADNDTLGQLAFVGRNDNSQDFNAFQMTAYSSDVSDGTEDGTMQMFTMQNGSLHLAMQITPTETVFNDSSKDQDFRVETNGQTHAIFAEGGTDRVGILNSSPQKVLDVTGDAKVSTDLTVGDDLFLLSDAAVIHFGADSDVTLTHDHNVGLILITEGTANSLAIVSGNDGTAAAPVLNLKRDSASPADGDDLGRIEFTGRNDNSQDVAYGRIRSQLRDASDGTEDGKMDLGSIVGGTEIDWLTFDALDTAGASVIFNQGSADIDFRVESNDNADMLNINAGTNRVGIAGPADLGVGLHIRTADSGASVAADCDELVIENSANAGISILSGTSNNGRISFGDSGGNQMGQLKYEHSVNSLIFNSNNTEALRISTSQVLSTGAEASPDTTNGGITIQTNAEDDAAFTLKNSDVDHGMTAIGIQTDTYAKFLKNSAADGGLRLISLSDSNIAFKHEAFGTGENTAESNAATSNWCVDARKKNGTSVAGLAADDNLASFRTSDESMVIIKGDGEIFSNQSATVGTFDSYEDAQLVRAFDLNHMQGVINSKFDKFVQYNKDDLQKARLIGTDDDGNATPFVSLTGMSRLHNGAIWQQYEKHQRLAEAVYEMAKETLGADKADAILKKHDIKLLN